MAKNIPTAPSAESTTPAQAVTQSVALPLHPATASFAEADIQATGLPASPTDIAMAPVPEEPSFQLTQAELDELKRKKALEEAGQQSLNTGDDMLLAQADTAAETTLGSASGAGVVGTEVAAEAAASTATAAGTSAATAGTATAGAATTVAGMSPWTVGLGALGVAGAGAAAFGGGGGGGSDNSQPATDTTAPVAPTLALATDTGLSTDDGITNEATVTVSGLEAGASWEYSTDNGATWTTGSGTSFALNTDGTHSVIARQTDAAGNTSGASESLSITLDTQVAAPTLTLAVDSGLGDDLITNQVSVAVSGLEAGSSWEYSTDNGVTWTTGSGTSFALDADGLHSVVARQTDAAGNISNSSGPLDFVLDTVAPNVLSMTASGDKIVITYDSSLDEANLPGNDAFSVQVNGSPRGVTELMVTGAKVTLTLASALTTGDLLQIGYTDPTADDDANAIQDIAGNDASSFIQGKVADGYVRGAQIWIDTDNDGKEDYNTGLVTDAEGNFFLPAGLPKGTIVAKGGVNIDTGVANTMALKAPAGSTTINPLTTLVQAVIEKQVAANPGTVVDDTLIAGAAKSVADSLGLTFSQQGVSLTNYDPIATGNVAVQKVAAQVATIVTLAATKEAEAGDTVIGNLADEVKSAGNGKEPINLADAGTLNKVLTNTKVADDVEQQSAIADASVAIGNAKDLAEVTTAQSKHLDKIAPDAPTLDVAAISNVATPTVRIEFDTQAKDGTAAVVGDTLRLRGAGETLTEVTLTASHLEAGFVELEAPSLAEGEHRLDAILVDKAGNQSSASATTAVLVDTLAPDAATIDMVAGDNIINASEQAAIISGSAEALTTLSLTLGGNIRTIEVDAEGHWSYQLTEADLAAMGQGSETIGVQVTDIAGNQSDVTSQQITIDTKPPEVPVIQSTVDSVTNVNTLTLNLTAEAGSLVEIYDGEDRIGQANEGEDGQFSFTIEALEDGDHSFTAVATDAAGNNSPASAPLAFEVDTTAPDAPEFQAGDSLTNNNTVTLNLTAEAGSTVEVYNSETLLGKAVEGESGQFSFTTEVQTDGEYSFTARATDAAGNISELAQRTDVTVDTVAPSAPSYISFDDNISNGVSRQEVLDGFAARVSIYGSDVAEGDTLELLIDDVIYGSVQLTQEHIDAGEYSFTVQATEDELHSGTFVDGDYVFSARLVDKAGNIGEVSDKRHLWLDTKAPTALKETSEWENAIEVSAGIDGRYDEGDTITLRFSESVKIGEDGLTLADLSVKLADGTPGSFGEGVELPNWYYHSDSLTITLGANPVIEAGAQISIAAGKLQDWASNSNNEEVVFTAPEVPTELTIGVWNHISDEYHEVTIDDLPEGDYWHQDYWNGVTSRFQTAAVQLEGWKDNEQLSELRIVDLHTGEVLAGTSLDPEQFLLPSDSAEPLLHIGQFVGGEVQVDTYPYGLNVTDASLVSPQKTASFTVPDDINADNSNVIRYVPAADGMPAYLLTSTYVEGAQGDYGYVNNWQSVARLHALDANGITSELALPEADWVDGLIYAQGAIWLRTSSETDSGDDYYSYEDRYYTLATDGNSWSEVTEEDYWDAWDLTHAPFSVIRVGDYTLDTLDLVPEGALVWVHPEDVTAVGENLHLARIEVELNDGTEDYEHWVLLDAAQQVIVSEKAFDTDTGIGMRHLYNTDDAVYFQQVNVTVKAGQVVGQGDPALTVHRLAHGDLEAALSGSAETLASSGNQIASFTRAELNQGGISPEHIVWLEDYIPLPDGTGALVVSAAGLPEDESEDSFAVHLVDVNGQISVSHPLPAELDDIHVDSEYGVFLLTESHYDSYPHAYHLDTNTGQLSEIPVDQWDRVEEGDFNFEYYVDGPTVFEQGALDIHHVSQVDGVMALALAFNEGVELPATGIGSADLVLSVDSYNVDWDQLNDSNIQFADGVTGMLVTNTENWGEITIGITFPLNNPFTAGDQPFATIALPVWGDSELVRINAKVETLYDADGVPVIDGTDSGTYAKVGELPAVAGTPLGDDFYIFGDAEVSGGEGRDVFSIQEFGNDLKLQDFTTGIDTIDIRALLDQMDYNTVASESTSATDLAVRLLEQSPDGLADLVHGNDISLDNVAGAIYTDNDPTTAGGEGVLTLFVDTRVAAGEVDIASFDITLGAQSTGFALDDLTAQLPSAVLSV